MAVKLGIIGDIGIDRYHVGKVRGLSAEAPIPVVDIIAVVDRPGMAANVLSNVLAMGEEGLYIASALDSPCPVKNRLVTQDGQQLARWDEQDTCPGYFVDDLGGLINVDGVIVCDYGKGSITPEVISFIRGLAIPVFVDTKNDPKPWVGSDVILFPNQLEYDRYEASYGWLPAVVLKQGSKGLSYLEFGSTILSRPAQARAVSCVNGAGDTLISAFAISALTGHSLPECMEIGNVAAGIVVEQHFLNRQPRLSEIVMRLESEGYYDDQVNDAGKDSVGSGICGNVLSCGETTVGSDEVWDGDETGSDPDVSDVE